MSQNTKKNGQNSRKRTQIILFSVLLLLLLAGVAAFLLYPRGETVKGGQREADALQGSLQKMTDAEIQKAMNNIVDQGMFRISIASDIVAIENEKADVRIENNQQNRYLMKVKICLDETGEEIYCTDFIEPGYYIEQAQLKKQLAPGQYPATAMFYAYYPDTEELVGMVGAHVTIYALSAADATKVPQKNRS